MNRKATSKTASNNIAEARRFYEKKTQSKFTQEDAAREFGIGLSTYRNYEQEKSLPDGSDAARIAKKYGVTVDYLMGLSDVRYAVVSLDQSLTDDERELLNLYRSMSAPSRSTLIRLMKAYLKEK